MAGSWSPWSIISNAGTLSGGRLMLAVLRFLATLVILQRAGLERFGEFALILSVVAVAEWLSDFGLSDVAVRQIMADPSRKRLTLGAFALSKLAQGALAATCLMAGMSLAGYNHDLVQAAQIGAVAVLCYAGVQVYRVEFRVRMQMGREVGAELLATIVFLAAVWAVTGADASLQSLAGCYLLLRVVNLVAAGALARSWPDMGFAQGWRAELTVLLRACVPLGLTGLMVSTYDAMEQVALSQWSSSAEVGTYSFAMRVMMLALIVQQALATAAFPLLAAQWAQNREAFLRTQQTVLDWGLLISGAMFCALHTSANSLVALIKHDPQGIAQVLQWLAWAIPARAAVALVGPVLVISGQLGRAVWIPLVVLVVKWLALMVLAERGALGAAAAFLLAEVGIGLLLNLLFCQYAAGVWLRWSVAIKLMLAALAVVGGVQLLGLSGTLLQGLLAAAVFLALSALMGAVRLQELKQLVLTVAARRSGRT